MVQCNRCNLQYTGETKRRLKDRFNEHRSPVDKDKALNDLSPEYISELLNKPKYTRNLRSQSQLLLSVPKSRTVTYGDRAFLYALLSYGMNCLFSCACRQIYKHLNQG